jgi:hypothetical protein
MTESTVAAAPAIRLRNLNGLLLLSNGVATHAMQARALN